MKLEGLSQNQFIKLDKNTQVSNPLKDAKLGDIFSGTVSKIEKDKVTIALDTGFEFQISKDGFVGSVGDNVKYKVMDTKGNGVVMKQILENQEEAEAAKEKSGEDKQANWVKGSVRPINGEAFANLKALFEDMEVKNIEAVSKIKKQISGAVNNISKSAVAALVESGIDLSEINLAMLNDAIKSVASNTAGNNLDKDQLEQAIAQYADKNNAQDYKATITSLESILEQGLPITNGNISSLKSVHNKIGEIKNSAKASDEGALNLIAKGDAPTVDNVYKALHSGHAKISVSDKSQQWNSISSQVSKMLSGDSPDILKAGLDSAKTLFENDLPLTKENIELLRDYKTNIENLDETLLINEAAKNIKNGKPTADIGLFGQGTSDVSLEKSTEILENYASIINNLPKVSDSMLIGLINSGVPITAKTLTESALSGLKPITEHERNNKSFITQKRQLEELRLKLTMESAGKMARAGIEIDTLPLQEAVEKLRELERQSLGPKLDAVGAQNTPQNIESISNVFNRVNSLKTVHDMAIRAVHDKEIDFNIDTISKLSERFKAEEASRSYESVSTAPNAKFGDSFSKITDQVEDVLNTLGIEVSPDNVKSARTIVRTGLELNNENLEGIKNINSKLYNLTQKLHPMVAANMIKDGFNPMENHVDDVLNYIDKYNETYGATPSESFEQGIYQMDKKNLLTPNEREAMVGIYRMVSTIEKNETAAAGILAKSNKSLTLENLMEAGKYFDKTKGNRTQMDKTIDDDFGAAEKFSRPEDSIRSQLDKAFKDASSKINENGITDINQILANANMSAASNNLGMANSLSENGVNVTPENLIKMANSQNSIENLIGSLTPQSLSKVMEQNEIKNMPIDELAAKLSELNAENNPVKEANIEMFMETVKTLENLPPQALLWLNTLGMPPNIGNLKAAQGFIKDSESLGKGLNKLSNDFKNATKSEPKALLEAIETTDLEALRNGDSPQQILDKINAAALSLKSELVEHTNDTSIDVLRSLSLAKSSAMLAKTVSSHDDYYQIPIKLNDKISNLNVYLLNENADNASLDVFLQLNTSELGSVQTYLKMDNGSVNIKINTQNGKNSEFLMSNADVLEGLLSELNVKDYTISFGNEDAKNIISSKILPQKDEINAKMSTSEFEVEI